MYKIIILFLFALLGKEIEIKAMSAGLPAARSAGDIAVLMREQAQLRATQAAEAAKAAKTARSRAVRTATRRGKPSRLMTSPETVVKGMPPAEAVSQRRIVKFPKIESPKLLTQPLAESPTATEPVTGAYRFAAETGGLKEVLESRPAIVTRPVQVTLPGEKEEEGTPKIPTIKRIKVAPIEPQLKPFQDILSKASHMHEDAQKFIGSGSGALIPDYDIELERLKDVIRGLNQAEAEVAKLDEENSQKLKVFFPAEKKELDRLSAESSARFNEKYDFEKTMKLKAPIASAATLVTEAQEREFKIAKLQEKIEKLSSQSSEIWDALSTNKRDLQRAMTAERANKNPQEKDYYQNRVREFREKDAILNAQWSTIITEKSKLEDDITLLEAPPAEQLAELERRYRKAQREYDYKRDILHNDKAPWYMKNWKKINIVRGKLKDKRDALLDDVARVSDKKRNAKFGL